MAAVGAACGAGNAATPCRGLGTRGVGEIEVPLGTLVGRSVGPDKANGSSLGLIGRINRLGRGGVGRYVADGRRARPGAECSATC